MQVTAVVPNWNGRDLLPLLLSGLAAQTLPPAEVILVDNGSTDDSIEIASGLGARVISLPGNLGFAAAVNRGVAAAQSEFVAVLNNDVTLGTDWLRTISSAMKNGNTM